MPRQHKGLLAKPNSKGEKKFNQKREPKNQYEEVQLGGEKGRGVSLLREEENFLHVCPGTSTRRKGALLVKKGKKKPRNRQVRPFC